MQSICSETIDSTDRFNYNLSKDEFIYLGKKLPLSASLKTDREKSLQIDPEDLVVWKDYLFFERPMDKKEIKIKSEYCKKAIEGMQWDHIYYISNWKPFTGDLINILKDDSIQDEPCTKVVKLALKGWDKEHLYSAKMINPTADEFANPNQYEITQKEIRDLMKKRIGRDLDNEQKVRSQVY